MGDIFNNVVIFLEDYYVYVIGVGLIIILMLIGFLTSKRKSRKVTNTEEPMANINDVNTGSINDVANTLQSDAMQPVDVANYPNDYTTAKDDVAPNQNAPEITPTPIAKPLVSEPIARDDATAPIASETVTNVANEQPKVDLNATPVTPILEDYKPLPEVTPVAEDRFDKTEIMDLSTFEPVKPAEPKAVSPIPFVIDNSQTADSDSILNGENTASEDQKF